MNFLTESSSRALRNKRFFGGVWNNLDLSGRSFDHCTFSGTELDSCNLYDVRVKGGHLSACEFANTNFSLAHFKRVDFSSAVFLKCSFTGSIWEQECSFIDCLFYKCDLTGVVVDSNEPLRRTIFKNCLIPDDDMAERLKMLGAIISHRTLSNIGIGVAFDKSK
jgi:uncharacterized protein YjbI with pentapeptide repeats